MKINDEDKQRYIKAKEKVRKIQIFYLHLLLYVIVMGLLIFNLYILEEGPYKSNITALNVTTIVIWSVFIIIHAWRVFKGPFLFGKRWEDKKINEIVNKNKGEETTFWE
jgi:hypothetical protein